MKFQAEHILIPIAGQNLQIRYYGIIIVVAMLVAAIVAARLAKRSKLDPDHVWGALTWAIIPGIIGARLWFVLFPPITLIEKGHDLNWFLQNFFNLQEGAIAIWSGGLSIFGAVLGGGLGAYLYMRRNKLNYGVWLDIAAVAIPLGQAIGRWANYVNQELYGTPTTLPWGITISTAKRVAPFTSTVEYPTTTLFHPLFLYESLWCFLAFIVLLNIYQRQRSRLRQGDIFLLFIAQYSLIRFLLEFLRVEVAYLPGTTVNSSQVICIIGFVLSIGYFLYRHRAGVAQPAPVSAPSSENVETPASGNPTA